MTKQRKAAALAFVVALTFVALELAFDIRVGLAGLFVMGMAGGLLIGDRMAHESRTADEAARSGGGTFRLISIMLPVTSMAIGLTDVRAAAAQQDARAAEVDHLFSTYPSTESPGCVVGVVHAGELVLARGYGMADLEQGRALAAGSVMRVGSMAKQFTAASIALLAADGVLSLDDDVRKFLPELPDYGSTITVRHLLHHTSGIRNYYYLMGLAGNSFENVQTDADRLSLIARQRAINCVLVEVGQSSTENVGGCGPVGGG